MFLRQVVVLMLKGYLLCFLSSNMLFNTFTSSGYVSYFARKLFDPSDCNI